MPGEPLTEAQREWAARMWPVACAALRKSSLTRLLDRDDAVGVAAEAVVGCSRRYDPARAAASTYVTAAVLLGLRKAYRQRKPLGGLPPDVGYEPGCPAEATDRREWAARAVRLAGSPAHRASLVMWCHGLPGKARAAVLGVSVRRANQLVDEGLRRVLRLTSRNERYIMKADRPAGNPGG